MRQPYRIVRPNGTIAYYKDKTLSELHRLDGPAVILPDGTESWWANGTRHRLDGPAIEYPNGERAWFVNGEFLCMVNSLGEGEIIDKMEP